MTPHDPNMFKNVTGGLLWGEKKKCLFQEQY